MPGRKSRTPEEGRAIVLVRWRKEKSGFRLWIDRRPKLAVVEDTFDEASEAIWQRAAELTGDGEVTLDFDPAPPLGDTGSEVLALLGAPHGPHWYLIENRDDLFNGKMCPSCRRMTGERTPARMVLGRVNPGADGGSGHPELHMQRPSFYRSFFSKEFIARLTPAERRQFEWRPVDHSGRKKYFEIIEAKNPAPFVAIRSRKPDYDGICRKCGLGEGPLYHGWRDSTPLRYVSEDDLPRGWKRRVIAVGEPNAPTLAMGAERWKEFRGKAGGKVLTCSPIIGVVSGLHSLSSRAKRGIRT